MESPLNLEAQAVTSSTHNLDFKTALKQILIELKKLVAKNTHKHSRSLLSRQSDSNNPSQPEEIISCNARSIIQKRNKQDSSELGVENERDPETLLKSILSKQLNSYQKISSSGVNKTLENVTRQTVLLDLIAKCSQKNSFTAKILKRYIYKISTLHSTVNSFFKQPQENQFEHLVSQIYTLVSNLFTNPTTTAGPQNHMLTFDNLQVDIDSYHEIPGSEGILYEAATFMPGTTMVAVAFRIGSKGSVCVYDFKLRKTISELHKIHSKWVNHLIWIDRVEKLVTCSNDTTIKVMTFTRNQLKVCCTLKGHIDLIRCLKYIDSLNVLISGGDDPDLKVWNLKHNKLICRISTQGRTNMDGSFAYIPSRKLVGVGFRCGVIDFYHVLNKYLMFQIKTGYSNFYTYGLQYHLDSKLIIGRVKEHTIKAWTFDEDTLEVKDFANLQTQGVYPDCLLLNGEGNELMTSSRDGYLEIVNLLTLQKKSFALNHISKTNCLRYLPEHKKLLVCDYNSEYFCLVSC